VSFFLDQVVNGLTSGAEYALVAAGLALIFGVLEIVNFAHGEFFMLGSYLLWIGEAHLGLPYGVAAPVGIVGMAVFGGVFYLLVIRRILGKGWQIQLVATLAVSILMINLAIVLAGSLPKNVHSSLAASGLSAGGLHVSYQRIVVVVAALVSFTALALFLRLTKTGKSMRAVAQNREAASVAGIPIQRVGFVAVMCAAALAGVASVTISPLYNVSPTMGSLPVIKAFAAVIMGGFGNVTGAIISAFVLGLAEAFSIGYVSSAYADAIVFSLMIIVLLVRPQGVFGKAVRA
jgi:branched-chain amino acid transport system permease protein